MGAAMGLSLPSAQHCPELLLPISRGSWPLLPGAQPWGRGSEDFFLPFQVEMGFFEGQ